jgi:hypothetical protein
MDGCVVVHFSRALDDETVCFYRLGHVSRIEEQKAKRKLFDFNRMIVVPYILKKTDFGQHVFHVDPRAISSIVVV